MSSNFHQYTPKYNGQIMLHGKAVCVMPIAKQASPEIRYVCVSDDWNRVMLPMKRGQENTDYINASYIDVSVCKNT